MITSDLVVRAQAELELRRRRAAIDYTTQEEYADPLNWILNNVYIPEIHGLIKLAPYQKWCLQEALALEPDGSFRYSTIVWSDIKKSIKSCLAAAVALWRAASTPWGQVILVANDLRQAESRIGYYLRRSIELNPELHRTCSIKNYRVDFPNRAFVESVPIDPTGEAGSNADMICYSELWGSHSQAQKRMFVEMALPPGKFGKSFRWIETYAGYHGESDLLRQLYDLGMDPNQGGEVIPGGDQFDPPLRVYRNREARLFMLWNDTPRLSWQTSAYYEEEAKILEPAEFDRIHRNQWTASIGSFIQVEHWDACKGVIAPLSGRDPVIVAMDAAVSGDCFGIAAVTRRNGITEIVESRKWIPPKGGKIDYEAEEGPENYMRYLCDKYNVIECAYDPYQLHSVTSRLQKELVTFFRPFNQGTDRLIADKMLKDAIQNRAIRHNGDPDLREHATNALAKIEGDKIRIVKKNANAKVDLLVCLSMANARAVANGLD
jgi:phage terminase large subunit-like protein